MCYNCGESGHRNRECTKDRVTCNKCGKDGHLERFCDDVKALIKSKAKKENKTVLCGEIEEHYFCKCTTVMSTEGNDAFENFDKDCLINKNIDVCDRGHDIVNDDHVPLPPISYCELSSIESPSRAVLVSEVDESEFVLQEDTTESLSEIIYDSASHETVVKNSDLLTDIKPLKNKTFCSTLYLDKALMLHSG